MGGGAAHDGVNRDLSEPGLRSLLTSRAFVAGADAHYFFDSKREWVVHGRIAGSDVAGSRSAILDLQRAPQRYYQRPDASHVEIDPAATGLRGWTGSVNLNRNSGVHQVNSALWGVSPGFDSNDAGFNFNGDRAGFHAVYSWSNPKVTRWARSRALSVAKWYVWNFARETQGDGLHAFGQVQFRNYWQTFNGVMISRAIQDDRATRGGPLMTRPRFWAAFGGVETDNRKRVTGSLDFEVVKGEDGGSSLFLSAGPKYRPAASLELSVAPTFSRQQLPVQYVNTFEDPVVTSTFGSRYVFGTLDHKEFSLQTRVNYVLSPKLSLQVYAQPLVSVGDYGDFKELARPRSYDFIRYGVDQGSLDYDALRRRYTVEPGDGGAPFDFDDPDFNFKSLRLNAILRWEWRPGSAMYVVWTEQREDFDRPGQFTLGRDMGSLFRADPDDVILFKVAYWFSR